MSKILLQTTIPASPDDWDITRFSLLTDELRAAGHEVMARNRGSMGADDPVLSRVDELDYDQLWLMAVDVGDGLTSADAEAIMRFRGNGGGVLTARDTPSISWPNYHSGCNGDYQPAIAGRPVHELLRTIQSESGRIEYFPAHPHEGWVASDLPFATAVAQGASVATGRRFNLAVALDGERSYDGRTLGRAVAESTFHHFADYNWDLDCGAPSFVSEPPGTQIKADPSHLLVFKDYVRNVASWLHPTDSRKPAPSPWQAALQQI